jgi:hypothetical protein
MDNKKVRFFNTIFDYVDDDIFRLCVDLGFIIKEGGIYGISNPIYRKVIESKLG